MRCRTAQELVVAAVDGELSERRSRALARHLAGCPGCRTDEGATRRLLARLETLAPEAPVPAALEQRVLRTVRLEAAAEAERRAAWIDWRRTLVPVAATGALAALLLVTMREADQHAPVSPPAPATVARHEPARPAPGPAARRTRAPVPADPPPELAQRPELFMDLPMLPHLEKLEHFDAIAGTADDAGPPANGTEPASNG